MTASAAATWRPRAAASWCSGIHSDDQRYAPAGSLALTPPSGVTAGASLLGDNSYRGESAPQLAEGDLVIASATGATVPAFEVQADAPSRAEVNALPTVVVRADGVWASCSHPASRARWW